MLGDICLCLSPQTFASLRVSICKGLASLCRCSGWSSGLHEVGEMEQLSGNSSPKCKTPHMISSPFWIFQLWGCFDENHLGNCMTFPLHSVHKHSCPVTDNFKKFSFENNHFQDRVCVCLFLWESSYMCPGTIEAGGQHQVLSLIFETGSLGEFGAHWFD